MLFCRAQSPFSLSVKPLFLIDGTHFEGATNGDPVTSIKDKVTGTALTGTMPTILSASGSGNTVNGQKSLGFVATPRLEFDNLTITSDWSLVSVWWRNNTSSAWEFVEQGVDTNSANGMYLYGGGTGMIASRQSGNVRYTSNDTSAWRGSPGAPYTKVLTNDQGVVQTARLNGVAIVPTATTGTWGTAADVTAKLYIGARSTGSLQFTGRLLYLAIYPGVLSTADIEKAERYLRRRFRHY